MIHKLICFGICLVVGNLVLEETMDSLYPNRSRGFFKDLFYGWRKRK